MLNVLWYEKYNIRFHDTIHPTLIDSGAYFNFSTEKSYDSDFWSMTYGNHGWSGGIYGICSKTLNKHIPSLVKTLSEKRYQITPKTPSPSYTPQGY